MGGLDEARQSVSMVQVTHGARAMPWGESCDAQRLLTRWCRSRQAEPETVASARAAWNRDGTAAALNCNLETEQAPNSLRWTSMCHGVGTLWVDIDAWESGHLQTGTLRNAEFHSNNLS